MSTCDITFNDVKHIRAEERLFTQTSKIMIAYAILITVVTVMCAFGYAVIKKNPDIVNTMVTYVEGFVESKSNTVTLDIHYKDGKSIHLEVSRDSITEGSCLIVNHDGLIIFAPYESMIAYFIDYEQGDGK